MKNKILQQQHPSMMLLAYPFTQSSDCCISWPIATLCWSSDSALSIFI